MDMSEGTAGYETSDLGEQAWTDLLARGSREGFGPALLDLLREAEDRGIERAIRRWENLGVFCAAEDLRALKGGGR